MKLSLLVAALPLAFARPNTVRRRDSPAPIVRRSDAQAIADKYIVVLKPDDGQISIQSTMKPLKATPDHVYESANFKGFAGQLDEEELTTLQDDPTVSYIYPSWFPCPI